MLLLLIGCLLIGCLFRGGWMKVYRLVKIQLFLVLCMFGQLNDAGEIQAVALTKFKYDDECFQSRFRTANDFN